MFVYLVLIILSLIGTIARSDKSEIFVKCCENGSILNETFQCTNQFEKTASNGSFFEAFFNMTNKTEMMYTVCFKNEEGGEVVTEHEENEHLRTNDTCTDFLANGTLIKLMCDSRFLDMNDSSLQQCDSLFTQSHFWGASIVTFATIVYNVPYTIVAILYCALPELRNRAYDRAVLSYNIAQIMINVHLIFLGFTTLCHKTLSITSYRLLGLGIMFSVESTMIWLLIICFDMTLVITRFRWAPKSGGAKGREENRKSLIYAAWGWGLAAFLTAFPTVIEFSPLFPEDSIFRPNFHKFQKPNVAVIIYVISGPVLICLTNTCLFIYTTVKTIAVQKSTAIINENREKNIKKKYFVFLKLYVLMDAPWVSGALAAIFQDLWVLKFVRMSQPILMLILIVPRKRVIRAMGCLKDQSNGRDTIRLNNESRKQTNSKTTNNIVLTPNC